MLVSGGATIELQGKNGDGVVWVVILGAKLKWNEYILYCTYQEFARACSSCRNQRGQLNPCRSRLTIVTCSPTFTAFDRGSLATGGRVEAAVGGSRDIRISSGGRERCSKITLRSDLPPILIQSLDHEISVCKSLSDMIFHCCKAIDNGRNNGFIH